MEDIHITRENALIEDLARKIHIARERVHCPPQQEGMHCFTFQKLRCKWQGVVFADGYVVIRGTTIDHHFVTCQYNDISEMIRIRDLKYKDIFWLEG